MQLSSIVEKGSYIASIPARTTEVRAVVMPLTYLGNDRWYVQQAATGRAFFLSGRKFLRRATLQEAATGQVGSANGLGYDSEHCPSSDGPTCHTASRDAALRDVLEPSRS